MDCVQIALFSTNGTFTNNLFPPADTMGPETEPSRITTKHKLLTSTLSRFYLLLTSFTSLLLVIAGGHGPSLLFW